MKKENVFIIIFVIAIVIVMIMGFVWYNNQTNKANQELKEAVDNGKETIDEINNRIKPIQNSTFSNDSEKAIND